MIHDTELCNTECCHDRKINVVVSSVFLEILYFGKFGSVAVGMTVSVCGAIVN